MNINNRYDREAVSINSSATRHTVSPQQIQEIKSWRLIHRLMYEKQQNIFFVAYTT